MRDELSHSLDIMHIRKEALEQKNSVDIYVTDREVKSMLSGPKITDGVATGYDPITVESCLLNALCPYDENDSVGKAQHVVRQGLHFSPDAVYVVRTGCIKIRERTGQLKWTSFRLPHEIFGIQSMFDARVEDVRAMATMDSQLCRLPRRLLLSRLHDNLQLTQSLIQASTSEQALLRASLFRHRMRSGARVADFLLEMSRRLPVRAKGTANLVELRMSRRDIACHLGMTQETLSRVFKRLADARLIEGEGREICLLDIADLRRLSISRKEHINRL